MNATDSAEKQTIASRLVDALEKRKAHRGFMSVLRRAAGEAQPLRAYQAFSNLPNGVRDPVVQAVAMLFARLPLHSKTNRNLGESLAEVVARQFPRTGKNEIMVSSFDARFNRLMTARSFDELQSLLLRLWPLLEHNTISVDYERLYGDLRNWNENSEFYDTKKRDAVKIQWAKTYWSSAQKRDKPEEEQA